MTKKIHSCRELFCATKEKNKKYLSKIRKEGGINLYMRALLAQVLWFALFYNLGIMLVPVKDAITSNAIVLATMSLIGALKAFIGDKIPSVVDDFIKGKFFYEFSLDFLNKWIIGLAFIVFIQVMGQVFYFDNYKIYGKKK
ncbi:MAG: hypothetical protein ACOYS2_02830 [Patescibacteria group bacterium]